MSEINVQVIQDAQRIEQFLTDEVVQTAFEVMGKRAYADFLTATTNEQRQSAQAKALAVQELQTALHAVVSAGEHEAILAERKARRESATRAPNPED